MAKSHIPVKVVDRLPDNVFAHTGWPGPGLYLGPNGSLYLVVDSIVMMMPVGSQALLVRDSESETAQATPPAHSDHNFLLKLVAISQNPALAKDLTA